MIDVGLVLVFGAIGETPSSMTGAERAQAATANHLAFAVGMGVAVAWAMQQQNILLGQAQRERARSDRMLESASRAAPRASAGATR